MAIKAALVGMVIIAAFIPVLALRQHSVPKEDPKYIRRVFGEHTVGQRITGEYPVHTIEVAVRGNDTYPATIIAVDEEGKERGRAGINLTPQDQWVRVQLTPPLTPGQPVITFTTTTETSQDQAILIRYESQSELYEGGLMIVDGEDSYGDIGFRTFQRVPLWQSVAIWGQITDAAAIRGLNRLLISLLIAGLLFAASRGNSRPVVVGGLLVLLALATFSIRVPYLQSIEGIFGGDAFNYLSKANEALQGNDPFAADPRKGPLYSLLLIPGFFTPDPLLWSRLVGMIAAAGAAVLLAFVAREFKLSWGLAIGAGVLLAVNQDFIWESPSGLANTLYVAFILGSILAYLKGKNRNWQWALAVLCGLTFLTRYEGVVIAAVLLPALWWREKLPWKRAILLITTAILIMMIPQVSLVWSGTSGIRTFEDLQADGGLSLVQSLGGLADNLYQFNKFINSMWLTPEEGDIHPFTLPAVGLGVLASVAIGLLKARSFKNGRLYWATAGLASLLVLAIFMLTKSSAARQFLIVIPWLFTGLGLVPFIRSRRYDALVVLAVALLQMFVILLILPKSRYFLPLIPFFTLLLVFGIHSLLQWGKSNYAQLATLFALGMLSTYAYAEGHQSLQLTQEVYNVRAHSTNMMIKAATFLRSQHGNVGIPNGDEEVAKILLPVKRRMFYKGGVDAMPELSWMKGNNIKYLVERSDGPFWQSVRERPDLFELLHTYENIHGEERVLVYVVKREDLP